MAEVAVAEAVVVRVQAEDFSPGAEIAALQAHGVGGIAVFVGVVRSDAARPIEAMTLEHYAGMTERALRAIAVEAQLRFGLVGCTVVHRVGRLLPGENIVFAGAASSHRQAALEAAAFLMDWLKTKAPFWKKEHLAGGESAWVAAKDVDVLRAEDWEGRVVSAGVRGGAGLPAGS